VSPEKANIPQGTLDLLILKTLALEPNHGLGTTRRIQQITRGTFQVSIGSIFPALHRMEEAGWVASQWGASTKNRKAKFYRLTAAGRKQLEAKTQDWERIALAVTRVLEAT
jgi:transcriptional regulator